MSLHLSFHTAPSIAFASPWTWGVSALVGGLSAVIIYLETTNLPSAAWLGIFATIIGLISGVSIKLLDIWNERKKERRKEASEQAAEDEAEAATEIAERTQLRREERDYYNSVIARLVEEKRIASRRAHAISTECDRLRNQTLKLVQLWPHDIPQPLGVVIFNEEMNRYLAELEELSLPEIQPRPSSLSDVHVTSGAELKPFRGDTP